MQRADDDEDDGLILDNEEMVSSPVSRWVPALVLLVAASGFIGLAWYAYNSSTRTLNEEELLLVEADKTPMKEKPLDPGGMKFPHQDKMIFEAISGTPSKMPHEEHVTPPPEEPVARPQEGTSQAEAMLTPEPVPPPHAPAPEAPQVTAPVAASSPAPPIPQAAPVVVFSPPPAAPPAPKPLAELPPVPAAKPAPPKPVAAKPPAPGAKAGAALAQLGAYRSEAEAEGAWKALARKNASLSGLKPLIVKADLGDKGIYYRLRVSVANAKSFCAGLNGQACIPVK